jgi:hypothetical protein
LDIVFGGTKYPRLGRPNATTWLIQVDAAQQAFAGAVLHASYTS